MTRPQASYSDPVQAAILVIAAMALIGLVDNLVPRIAEEVGLWQFHVMRIAIALPSVALIAWITGWQLWPHRPGAVFRRGAFLAASMVCYFGAIGHMTVAQAVAGLFTAPLWVALITGIWYREPVGFETIIAASVGFLGALMVLQPDPTALSLPLLMPVAGGFFYALCALATRRSCAGEGALSLLSGFLVALLLVSLVGLWMVFDNDTGGGGAAFLSRGWVWPSATALWFTAAQAGAVVVGVGLITRSYILAEAPQVAVFEYALLIFAAIWGWVLWGDAINATAGIGMALILASGVLLLRAAQKRPVAT